MDADDETMIRAWIKIHREDWRKGRRARLIETCRTGQDLFILGLRKFGYAKLAEKAV